MYKVSGISLYKNRLKQFIVVLFLVVDMAFAFADDLKPRIISLTPSLTDTVIALEGTELLVGVSNFDKQRLPALKLVESVGDFEGYSLEKIISLHPDIVLIWPGSIKPTQQQQLTSLGYEVIESDPHTLDELIQEIKRLGKKIGREPQARILTEQLQQKLDSLKQKYSRQQPVTVFFQLWDKPIYTIGKKQIMGDALTVCGAKNIFDDINLPAPQVNIETILVRNPQIIIASQQSLLDTWKSWPQVAAVKNNRLVLFQDERLARPSPSMIGATEKLCELLNN